MDVAWMVGCEGPLDHWELRVSMRSFLANYQSSAKLWIIGTIPTWVNRALIHCIDWPDPFLRCKDANLIHKALRLAMEPRLSDPFILCSDDHLLLRKSSPSNFRTWSDGQLPAELPDANKWMQRLWHTGNILRKAGLNTNRFDCHLPYPMRKVWIREALRFDYCKKPGMCVFSTILNASGASPELIGRKAVRGWMGNEKTAAATVDQVLKEFRFGCMSASSIQNPYTVSRLSALFADPAPWEQDRAFSFPLTGVKHEMSDLVFTGGG